MIMVIYMIIVAFLNIFGFADDTVNGMNKEFGTDMTGWGALVVFYGVALVLQGINEIITKLDKLLKIRGEL